MGKVISLKPPLYEAKHCHVATIHGEWEASGTLCGHIDFVVPGAGTYVLSPDEIVALIAVLAAARSDVLKNSDPHGDPRLYDLEAKR